MAIIPDFGPVKGQQSAEVASLGSVMAAGKAMQSFGGSMIDSANTVSEFARRQQARDDLDAENELRLVAQKAAAQHQLFREQNIDESTWEANRAELYKQVRDAAGKAKVSPQKRKELDLMVQSWDVESQLETATIGERAKSARQRTTGLKLVRAYEEAGKWDEGKQKRREMVEAGILHPDEGEADQQDADFRKDQEAVRDLATKYELQTLDDPVQVLEILSAKNENGYLNDSEMDEGIRAQLIRGAERELSRKQEFEFDTFKNAIDSDDQKVTEEEIRNNPLYLGEADKKRLIDYRKRFQPPTEKEDRKAWGIMQQVRDAYHAAKEGNVDEVEYRNVHRNARGEILELIPRGYSGPLLETLQRYSPARIYDMEEPDTADDVKKDAEIEIRATMRAFEYSNVFGDVGENATPLQKEKAASTRRDLERKAIQEFSKQKDATPEKAREIARRLVAGKVSASGANVLRNALPGTGAGLRSSPAMPYLPPKQGSKDKIVEDPLQIQPGTGAASDALLPKLNPAESRLNAAIE